MNILKSNIDWLIDKSFYTRTYVNYRFNKSTTISNWCTGKSYPPVIPPFSLIVK